MLIVMTGDLMEGDINMQVHVAEDVNDCDGACELICKRVSHVERASDFPRILLVHFGEQATVSLDSISS